nr:hypothetical protein [Tanacetum cinerariifolium]
MIPFVSILSACSELKSLKFGRELHELLVKVGLTMLVRFLEKSMRNVSFVKQAIVISVSLMPPKRTRHSSMNTHEWPKWPVGLFDLIVELKGKPRLLHSLRGTYSFWSVIKMLGFAAALYISLHKQGYEDMEDLVAGSNVKDMNLQSFKKFNIRLQYYLGQLKSDIRCPELMIDGMTCIMSCGISALEGCWVKALDAYKEPRRLHYKIFFYNSQLIIVEFEPTQIRLQEKQLKGFHQKLEEGHT